MDIDLVVPEKELKTDILILVYDSGELIISMMQFTARIQIVLYIHHIQFQIKAHKSCINIGFRLIFSLLSGTTTVDITINACHGSLALTSTVGVVIPVM